MTNSVNNDDTPTIDDAAGPRAAGGVGEAFPTIDGY